MKGWDERTPPNKNNNNNNNNNIYVTISMKVNKLINTYVYYED